MSRPTDIIRKTFAILLIASLLSCAQEGSDKKKLPNSVKTQGKIDPIDRQNGLTRQDVKDSLIKDRSKEKAEREERASRETPIPRMSKLIVAAPPPIIGGDKTISFSVTDQVPLKDVLIELGRAAKIDIDLDPTISGGIILNAKNRPLKEIIDRIASLGDLRYSYQNGVLHFERDTPYTKNYFVDYLISSALWSDVESNINSILTSTATSSADGSGGGKTSSVSINKSAGIMSAYASEKQHKEIIKYLAAVEKSTSSQVIIEAKLVEVKLKDEFKAGINWAQTDQSISIGSTPADSLNGGASLILNTIAGTDLNAKMKALETFGVTRTLSSPRIHAINNQKATLNFSDKLVYFKVDSTQSTSVGASTSVVAATITSTKLEENEGMIVEIVPSINVNTQEITLNIKPKITVKSADVIDPASPKNAAGDGFLIENKVPVMQTRELDTMAKIQSGNIVVIGGLMKEAADNTDIGVPFLSRIPVLGWLFKSTSRTSTITETVIFVKATIVNSNSPASKYDRDFQNKFDSTKRPFFN